MPSEIKIFGKLVEVTNGNSIVIDKIYDTNSLQEMLFKNYPALKDFKFFIAVNNKVVKQNTVLEPGATIALLPPFSGG